MLSQRRNARCLGGLFLLVALSLTGCHSDSSVSKTEEEQFKNPPKEMPEAARKVMAEHSAQPPQSANPGK